MSTPDPVVRPIVREWVIGDPECPYRFVFRARTGCVTIKVLDARTGAVLLPATGGDHKSIGFLEHQCRTLLQVFASAISSGSEVIQ